MPLLLLLIGLPLLELYVIFRVGEWLGVLPTLMALILSSSLGLSLMRSQGRVALKRFAAAIAEGRPPAREALDGALVFVGGTLLLVPGFVTDVAGALLLAPPTRALVRMLIMRHYAGRFVTYITLAGAARRRARPRPADVDGTAADLEQRELPR
jgi:UPF0716 protein FxsA